ncbi:MAG: hypothetical protein MJ071_08885 [Oscillospiraceae bacterium]|nr:hypothetical protein [Oscillospiraceae bacterium]
MKKTSIKRAVALLSAVASLNGIGTLAGIGMVNVAAADSGAFPFAMFASSAADGAITINAKHLCLNGSMASNGTIVNSSRSNINGKAIENAGQDMLYLNSQMNNMYFSNAETMDSLNLAKSNINVGYAVDVNGSASLKGNVNISSAVKAAGDITIDGNCSNAQNAVLYSAFGDIIIDSNNVNLNGIVYAPFGDVVITANNINLNNVVIIADTITLNSNNINANYGRNYASVIGTESSETKAADIVKMNTYLMDKEAKNVLDILSQYYNVTPVDAGEFAKISFNAPLAPGMVIPMNFDVEQYNVEGYGNLSIMKLESAVQQMSTIVLTPFDKDMPLISTDFMFFGENRTSYVEFYGLGVDGDENMPVFSSLATLRDKYAQYTDTAPSPGWFDEVRTMGLFKVTDYKSDDAIENMLYDSIRLTLDASAVAPTLEGEQKAAKFDLVQNYVDKLISNPGISTQMFNMFLGPDTTRCFFYDVFFGTSGYKVNE